MKRTESLANINGISKKSRYYLDPMHPEGNIIIIKPKDPELMKKNKSIIESSKKDAEKRKQRYIANFNPQSGTYYVFDGERKLV